MFLVCAPEPSDDAAVPGARATWRSGAHPERHAHELHRERVTGASSGWRGLTLLCLCVNAHGGIGSPMSRVALTTCLAEGTL